MNLSEIKLWLRFLLTPGLGVIRRSQVLDKLLTPENIYSSSEKELQAILSFIPRKITHQLLHYKWQEKVDYQLKKMDQLQVQICSINDPEYPALLKECPSAPVMLFYKGLPCEHKNPIAIVGSRKPVLYSKTCCERATEELVQCLELPIVSGLANGIDALAHRSCLKNKGTAIGVLAFGFDQFYPTCNRTLAEKIIERNGILYSEYPFGQKIQRNQFLERNRLIAGISRGTLVIQTELKSGSMSTASHCTQYNRDLFAVPYRIDTELYSGSHYLIQQGAVLYQSYKDIQQQWNLFHFSQIQKAIKYSQTEKIILDAITNDCNTVDTMIECTGLSFAILTQNLLNLELSGAVKADMSGQYAILKSYNQ